MIVRRFQVERIRVFERFTGGLSGAVTWVWLCYTARMFIHRIRITGRGDRGAWLWRPQPTPQACA